MNLAKGNTIVLSAGGTGGHMTPAAALGQDLLSRGFQVELITDKRGAQFKSMFPNIPVHVIRAGTLGAGVMGKIKGAGNLGLGYLQARKLLKSLTPSVVVGFGGYPSVPAVYAAQRMGIRTVIHEQNAIIGKANAMLSPNASRIALSLPNEKGLHGSDKVRALVIGNPVRPDIAALYNKPYPALEQDGRMHILVLGGSMGAHVFSEIVPKALSGLSAHHRAQLEVVQQCREEDMKDTKKAYKDAGIKVTLEPFFDDVAAQLEKAHLVIGRAGASTVAEITTAGRPAIFVPYPHHKDMQQKRNADAVADVGGAWVMSQDGFTAEALMARIETFLQNPETLFRAAEKARTCGKPDAALKLGNVVMALARGWEEK